MDLPEELPLPAGPSLLFMRRAQVVDLLGQAACFLLSGLLWMQFESGLAGFLFKEEIGSVYLFAAWQLLSALLHLLVWKRIPGTQPWRRRHLLGAGCIGLFCAFAALSNDGLDYGFILLGFGALFLAPLLAILYFCITAQDLWYLSAGRTGMVLEKRSGRLVGVQAFLLLLAIVPFYRFPLFSNFTYELYRWGFYVLLLVLAGWFAADYLKARRAGQATQAETVCAVWAIGVLCLYVAISLFSFHISIPYFGYFTNPVLVLSTWFAASLWRGPLREPVIAEQETKI